MKHNAPLPAQQVSQGYQPPLFNFEEDKVAVPSVRANLRHCRSVWRQVRAALIRLPCKASYGPEERSWVPCRHILDKKSRIYLNLPEHSLEIPFSS